MKIKCSNNDNIARVSTDGVLMVCLCENTCDNHASLKSLLDCGYKMLLHVKDENNNVVPLNYDRP